MPYTSYNAYIVQSNFFVILGIVVSNHLATIFNIKPLVVLFKWTYFQIAEILLIGACCYNMYNVSRDLVDPYIANIQVPFGKYLLNPGPITSVVYRLFHLIFSGLLGNKDSAAKAAAAAATTTPNKQDSTTNVDNVLSKFLSSSSTDLAPTTSSFFSFSNGQSQSQQPQQPTSQGIISNRFIIQPQLAANTNLTSQSSLLDVPPSETISGKPIPKLEYSACIKPPLEPSAHRERILWFLSPTPEVVEDFKIEQVLGFQKHWHRFSDRYSRTHYDKLTAALLKNIFTPLANSIETIDKKLAPKQSIATCSPGMVALSYLMPDYNNDTVFTIAEVLKFLTLTGYNSTDSIQYVKERVKDLASNKKMAAFTYTPKSAGMPTDSAIIMHIFNTYLTMKEPYAIPPLVPAEIDLFKFLLIYVYMTPELEHWKVFEKS